MLSGVAVRLRALVARRSADEDLDEELRYHLECEIERNIAGGMPPELARRAARRAFGNVTVATEQARDAMRWPLLEELRQDVVHAARSFRRAPAFVVAVTLTIGLGLGLLVTVFTLFDAYVLRPLAVRDPYALYEVSWHSRDNAWHAFTTDQVKRVRAVDIGFSQMFAYENLMTRVQGRPMFGQLVTGNYFDMLGVPPALGRTLTASDDVAPGSGAVMVLSHDTWRASFGADSTVIGRRVLVSGVSLTIVGVAREGFGGLSSWPFQFWVPMSMSGPLHGRTRIDDILKGPERARLVGHLAPGVTAGQASAKLEAWLRTETADRASAARAKDVLMESRGTSIPLTPELLELFAPIAVAFGLVMLIACANVANMMLARGLARQREVGIRLALGAGRRRLIRQFLTESLVLSVPSAAAAFLVSRAAIGLGTRAMLATVPSDYQPYVRPVELSPDARVLLFVLGGAILAAVTFGLVPALQATRPDVVRASRGDFDTPSRRSRLRSGLVVVQVTMSVLLLICAGVLMRAAMRIDRVDPGMRTADVVQLEVLDRSHTAVLAALRLQPGVRDIATASSYPLDGLLPGVRLRTALDSNVRAAYNLVSAGYFSALGMPILRGRAFSETDARNAAPVVLVSEGAAARFWPGQNPLGQSLAVAETAGRGPLSAHRAATVVGIVRDAAPGWIGLSPHAPVVYYPQRLDVPGTAILVRVAGNASAMRDRLDDALAAADPGAVQEVHTLEASLAVQSYPFRAAYWVASAIGLLALLLTLTGVYGVLGYVVAQRAREFGIRMALGASPPKLVALVLGHSMRLALAGFGIGGALALAVSRAFASVLYGIDTFDPLGYGIGALVVIAACFVASYVPSRRAALVDPVEALRADS